MFLVSNFDKSSSQNDNKTSEMSSIIRGNLFICMLFLAINEYLSDIDLYLIDFR